MGKRERQQRKDRNRLKGKNRSGARERKKEEGKIDRKTVGRLAAPVAPTPNLSQGQRF